MSWDKVSTTKNRLQEAMRICGKKQIDLERETGINRSTISRYLSGKYEPKADAIHKLAISLNCSETWLWGYDVPRARSQSQRRNDALSNAIKRAKEDTDFGEVLISLDSLTEEELSSIKQLLSVMKK
jgi:transcriptional regulator with XRE-family HTH domain